MYSIISIIELEFVDKTGALSTWESESAGLAH